MLKRKNKLRAEKLDEKAPEHREQQKTEVIETGEDFPKSSLSSRFDPMLTAECRPFTTSPDTAWLTSSRFDVIGGRKRIPAKSDTESKLPWQGEGAIIVKEKKKEMKK